MIIDFEKLEELRNEKVTFVIGTFDILHPGHVYFLEQAKAVGENHKLLVGIIPDAIVRARKGNDRPINTAAERAIVVDALRVVDYVFIAPELPVGEASQEVIDIVKPEYSVVSREDWKNRDGNREFTRTKLIQIDKIQELSTTKIVQKIRK